ncbi:hypothetical protein BpHYR1_009076 [Brachionus plicatilis]|uniref:Uncharacterized protein n=1 Tax=Brachionus plicatilis TaxID=10195 RepID=A0A3M7QNE9_BRAPC|nr:hypothetical protein BpHYR1_009076 [Brachionus plicatilis]
MFSRVSPSFKILGNLALCTWLEVNFLPVKHFKINFCSSLSFRNRTEVGSLNGLTKLASNGTKLTGSYSSLWKSSLNTHPRSFV